MFKLQVKFPRQDWKNTTYPARDRLSAQHLLEFQSKHWKHYAYRLVEVA